MGRGNTATMVMKQKIGRHVIRIVHLLATASVRSLDEINYFLASLGSLYKVRRRRVEDVELILIRYWPS